ncbi:MAG: FAD-dependent oxidoreductase [Chloroflexi bacterium]|nr:FAD-dependent oxidoreductase [Chloroflexota bacterium]
MQTIPEPSKQVPVVAQADVVVCGGGPGGFAAAIAAARHGAQTVLIERYGFMGGLATAGLVAPILGHTASRSHMPIVEGLLREITERMHAINGAPTWEAALQEWGVRFDAEALKIVLDEMCAEAGVRLMLHSYVADVVVDGGAIAAVIVENKSGRQAVAGGIFVDGTGDADVAFRAGAPTTHGRPFDKRPESMGSFFHLAGFEPLSEARRQEVVEQVRQEMARGRFRFYNPGFLNANAYHTDHTAANMTRFGGDSDVAEDMTAAELSVRGEVWKLVRYLQQNVPEFRGVYVQQTSPQVGPRESRQIVGPYALTGDDVRAGSKFDDAVARGSWWIDIHCPRGETYPVHLCVVECPKQEECPFWASEHTRMLSRDQLHPPDGDWYDIPYRSLLSAGIGNLLSTGRCISATHEGMAGSRVMGTCVAIGQAAGTAAALATSAKVAPADLDVRRLRDALRADGQLV